MAIKKVASLSTILCMLVTTS